MRSVTEYHGGPKCLTRVGLATRMVATTFLLNFLMISFLIYWAATGHSMIIASSLYFLIMLVIWLRGYRLKKRLAKLVESAAQRCGLKRVDPKNGNRPSQETTVSEGEKPERESEVSPQIPSQISPQS